MKTRLALLLCLALPALMRADVPAAPSVVAPGDRLSAEQLEQLVGPIALYPDALIALILPAATAPADIVLAARFLKDAGDPAAVSSRSWDESVKSLVHYAEVVKWMDDSLAWTKQLGEAFAEQPAEVMQAIQRLRARARAAGTLIDSPQQQLVIDGELISIVPTQGDFLYVPYYDPLVVYAPRTGYYGGTSFITYSSPFAAGAWLRFDCDWRQRTVWTVDRHWTSRDRHDWRHPVFPGQPGYVNDPNRHPWRPSATLPRMPVVNAYRPGTNPRTVVSTPPQRPGLSNDNPSNPPQRTDGRPRDPNFVGPVASTGSTPPSAGQAPAPSPTSSRRNDPGRTRPEQNDRPGRTVTFQNPPVTPPVAPANQPSSGYPFGPAPSSPIVPSFSGPVVTSPPPPAPMQRQPLFMPAAAPAPAPIAPPVQPPSDNKRGVNDGGEQKKQLN